MSLYRIWVQEDGISMKITENTLKYVTGNLKTERNEGEE